MKQSFHRSLIFLLLAFLLLSYSMSARPPGKGPKEMKQDLLNQLMGSESEECEEKDEECLKRRMIKEAHLDYIYTQHHKP